MAKEKTSYVCSACSGVFSKWAGQCEGCGTWDTLNEHQPASGPASRFQGYAGSLAQVQTMAEVGKDELVRFSTGMGELDRVLGGGLVPGSVVLIGGDPGIGKSTIALQISHQLARAGQKVLYISAEESVQQTKLRAERLGADKTEGIYVVNQTDLSIIIEYIKKIKPDSTDL